MIEPGIFNEIEAEVNRAVSKFGDFHSAHEGYAVILEEMVELQTEVFRKHELRNREAMRQEAIQVAAMAIKFIHSICPLNTERIQERPE